MSRTMMDLPFAQDPAFIQQLSENVLVGEGYHPVEYNGEINVWKKGTGLATAMHFIKLEYPEPGLLRLSGWVQAGIGSVGGKERALSGIVAVIPKKSTLASMKHLQDAVASYNNGQYPAETPFEPQPAYSQPAPEEPSVPEQEASAVTPEEDFAQTQEFSFPSDAPEQAEEPAAAEPTVEPEPFAPAESPEPAAAPAEPAAAPAEATEPEDLSFANTTEPSVEEPAAAVPAEGPSVETPAAETPAEAPEVAIEEEIVEIDPETERRYAAYLASMKKAEELAMQTLNAKPAPVEEIEEAPAAETPEAIVEEETVEIDPETERRYAAYLASMKKAEELAMQTLNAKPAPVEEIEEAPVAETPAEAPEAIEEEIVEIDPETERRYAAYLASMKKAEELAMQTLNAKPAPVEEFEEMPAAETPAEIPEQAIEEEIVEIDPETERNYAAYLASMKKAEELAMLTLNAKPAPVEEIEEAPAAETPAETPEAVIEEEIVEVDPETERRYAAYLASMKKAEELAMQTLNAKPAPVEDIEEEAPVAETPAEIPEQTIEEDTVEVDPETERRYAAYLASMKKAEELAMQTLNAKPAPAEETEEAPVAETPAEAPEAVIEEEIVEVDPETERNYAAYLASMKKAEELAMQTLNAKPVSIEEMEEAPVAETPAEIPEQAIEEETVEVDPETDDGLKKKSDEPVVCPPEEEPVPQSEPAPAPKEETLPERPAAAPPEEVFPPKKSFGEEISSNEPTRIFSRSELKEAANAAQTEQPIYTEPEPPLSPEPGIHAFHYEDIYSSSKAQRKAERQAERRAASAETDSIPIPKQTAFPPEDDGKQTIYCSGCGVKLRVQKSYNRLHVVCPKCGEAFIYEP